VNSLLLRASREFCWHIHRTDGQIVHTANSWVSSHRT
jgi:hypothetical protein